MDGLLNLWLAIPVQRRKRLVLAVALFVLLAVILWAVRSVLGPFILGLAIAYLLAPVIRPIERFFRWAGWHRRLGFLGRAARPLAILTTYLLVLGLLAGFFALVVPVVIDQARTLWAVRETIWGQLERLGQGIFDQYKKLPEQVRLQVELYLGRLSSLIGTALQQAAQGTVTAISYTVSLVLGIVIIPFWTFYLLNDSRELGQSALNMVPSTIRDDLLHILELVDTVFSAYLRGQLLLGFIIGGLTAVGLTLIGVNFSLVLGVVAGICELIPNIGPILGAIPALVVAVAQDPTKALITALFALGIQQLENLFLTPRVLGKSVQLHPVLVMVVLVIGSELGGVLGLFLAPLATAVLRDLFRYFYYRFADEPLSPTDALRRVHRREKLSLEV